MKYMIVEWPGGLRKVISEADWNAMPPSEQANSPVVQTGFATRDEAMQFMYAHAGPGVLVNKNTPPEQRDPRSYRRR